MAVAPMTPGLGVAWDLDAVRAKSLPEFSLAYREEGAPS